jgi:TP901 family phage tail tape measure protein
VSANQVVSVTLVARTSAYIAQMRAASAQTATFGASAATAGAKGSVLHNGMTRAASGAGLLQARFLGPAGLIYGLKQVVGAAVQFESEFVKVRKTMGGAESVLDGVALGLRGIALELPVTTTELNQIATVAGQLGIKANDVEAFTKTVAEMSMATNLTAEQAAIDFARLSAILGKPISEVAELGNVVVHLGNNMAAQETEIVEFAMRIAGVGSQMGMTAEDILALSATLPALGLRAEMGGTAITRIMVEIQAAVSGGTDKLALFAETAGMTADEFGRAWRSDPSAALLTFVQGVSGLSEAGADAFQVIDGLDLSMIRTQDTALRLAGGTEVFAEAQRLANEEMGRQTALQTEVARAMDTTASRAIMFKNNVKEAAIALGSDLQPAADSALAALSALFSFKPPGTDMSETENQRGATLSVFAGPQDLSTGEFIGAMLRDMSGLNVGQLIDDLGVFVGALEESETAAGRAAIAHGTAEAATLRLGTQMSASASMGRGWRQRLGEIEEANRGAAVTTEDHRTAAIGLAETLAAQNNPVLRMMQAVKKLGEVQADSESTAYDLASAVMEVHAAGSEMSGSFDGTVSPALRAVMEAAGLSEIEIRRVEDAFRDAKTRADMFDGTNAAASATLTFRTVGFQQTMNQIAAVDRVADFKGLGQATATVVPRQPDNALASGGPFRAGELNLVGEEGPELVVFGQPGTVIPADVTGQMLSYGQSQPPSGNTVTLHVTYNGTPDPVDDFRIRNGLRALATEAAY